ncbi:MAG: hypothetical protein ACREUN_06060, partial [Burkholderiales bacterium]
GLGRPVLFYAHPTYGYRLQPNQETWRFGGAHFKINNLGLRASHDWDRSPRNKILFLGDSVTYGGNHISNEDLFSEAATRELAGFRTGNAGIPNWGVENVHALVVREGFLPASVYVTTFIEDDFYRGLQSGQNKPWIKYVQPHFALQELAEFVWYKYFKNTREINRRERESEPPEVRVARAAAKLKEMDEFLKARGYPHLIFISPTRQQVLQQRPVDARVRAQLDTHGVAAVYLLDKPRVRTAPEADKRAWYQDNDHLTTKGHAVWGELIREELVRKLSERAVLVRR